MYLIGKDLIMQLIRKIKNCKRHRANKHLKESAEHIRWLAELNITEYNGDKIFVINPLMYEVIRFNNNVVPNNIKQSPLIEITEFIITVRTLEDYENEQNKWLKEWCGIPKGCDIPFTGEPLYLHIDKPIPPKSSVFIKEI